MRKKEDATTLLRILLHLSIHYKTNPGLLSFAYIKLRHLYGTTTLLVPVYILYLNIPAINLLNVKLKILTLIFLCNR